MVKDFLADHQIVPVLYPVANCFSGGVDSDSVNIKDYRRVTFVVFTGAIQDSGISNLVTVKAATDNAKTGATAISFIARAQQSSTTVDLWGARINAAAAGYNFATNNAVANAVWFIEVSAEEVSAQLAGATFVYLSIAETVAKTITAGAFAILSEPRYPQTVPNTAII